MNKWIVRAEYATNKPYNMTENDYIYYAETKVHAQVVADTIENAIDVVRASLPDNYVVVYAAYDNVGG